MFNILVIVLSLNIEHNRVRSIPTKAAISTMKRWCLEIQLQNDEIVDMDGDFDMRMTDDSISGPFRLWNEPQEDKNINDIKRVIEWLENKRSKNKGVFVAIVEEEECMLGFIQNIKSGIQVNGFMSRPFIEAKEHNIARSMLALEFLDMASSIDKNILFIFEKN